MDTKDFPLPPTSEDKEQKIKTKKIKNDLSRILFSAAKDEGRPALTGVNFITNSDLTLVTTDGFRLSLIKTEKQIDHPPFIAPAGFLEEVLRMINNEEEVGFCFLKEEKVIVFKVGENDVYSRLIEGEFPPFERVIPEKYLTKVVVDKDELVRAIKLIAVFARDVSNIMIFNLNKSGLTIKPKSDNEDDTTNIEVKIEGEEQTVAFNYRFVLDFLNHTTEEEKNIIIEILRPDAPVVFKTEGKTNGLHIIMPVRIQE